MNEVDVHIEYGDHRVLVVTFPGQEPARYCGDLHCQGTCALPLLVDNSDGDETRTGVYLGGPLIHNRGPGAWTGPKVYIPHEHVPELRRLWLR